jgi:hypothetical protein
MLEKFFTKTEAEAKVGKKIRTLVEFSGVPKGTTGQVLRADPAGRVKPAFEEAVEVYDLAIQWDLPTEPPSVASGELAGEPVTVIRSGKPLVDWFTKEKYERFLVEEE